MMDIKVIGLLLLGITLCYTKKGHHHKHHLKKNVDLGKAKSVITGKPKDTHKNLFVKTKSIISKKQSLGMPLNNMDEQGLGGEPVGHLDASEGVGGLGGDQDGIPIGMGAGAEPLGMSKGKESSNGMEENGGAMQGLGEEGESMHAGREESTRPFQGQDEGDFIEGGGGHGSNMMGGHSNNFMPSSGNSNGMNMMGSSHGGNMGNFMGNSNEGDNGGNYMGNGGGAGGAGGTGGEGGDNGGNFMGQSSDDSSYRGPKKDPLGGDIKQFNDEYKNDDGGHGGHGSHSMGNHHDDSRHGMSFSPMQDEGGEHMGGGSEHEFNNPSPAGDIGEVLNGNLAALDKVNIQGDSDVGKPGHGGGHSATFMGQSRDDGSYKGPGKDALGEDIKPFSDEHKHDEDSQYGGNSMRLIDSKHKGFSTQQEGSDVTDFTNPSPIDIGKALNGNLAALDSVNIQGDGDVAEMVRKATHQKEFTNNESGTLNGISLMEPGFSSTTKHFFGNGRAADRRTKGSHSNSKFTRTKHAVAKSKRPRIKARQ